MSKKIHGHKDFFTKFSLIFTGVFVLVGINLGLIYVFVEQPSWKWWFVATLLLMIWIGWSMRRTQAKMWYVFDKKSITIHLPSGKDFVLDKKNIVKEERIDRLSFLSGWGIKYIPWRQEFYFTTASSHILKLTMEDGRTIFLSPKEYV